MKIIVLEQATLTTGDICFDALNACGDVSYHDFVSPEKLISCIGDAEIVLCNKTLLTDEIMETCKNLKYIGVFATGYNNINLEAASKHHIYVANVPGYSTHSVVQHVFALLLSFASHIPEYDKAVHDGEWIRAPYFSYFPFPITELYGKTFGIFGYGAIGKAVATIAAAFGMNVLVTTRTTTDCPYPIVPQETLFRQSDFISIHCPLTEQTKEFICAETLAWMKPSAFFINTSRGGVVNEQDLADALNQGKIAGAGLDVLTSEPMRPDTPLFTAKNCRITPHTAWASKEARQRLVDLAAENVVAFQNGMPINIVNKM